MRKKTLYFNEVISNENILEQYKTNVFRSTFQQLRPIRKGDQELEKRLDQKELT
jgi:hypothetical protein